MNKGESTEPAEKRVRTGSAITMTLQAIRYKRGSLEILNQKLLPLESVYEELKSADDGFYAIKDMKVYM